MISIMLSFSSLSLLVIIDWPLAKFGTADLMPGTANQVATLGPLDFFRRGGGLGC